MSDFSIFLLIGLFIGLYEFILIRFVYFSNIDLFFDLVAGKKIKEKLRDYFYDEFKKNS